ncbi:hypothetical protein LTR50_000382 [Elasticomyces elasticus]|nr:hypothetical protein LTR50_000382 [Elasticomyces elasticus]
MPDSGDDAEFPCSLTIHIPLPNHRLANAAIQTLSVDQELSPLVQRSFSLVSPSSIQSEHLADHPLPNSLPVNTTPEDPSQTTHAEEQETVLKTEYRATTNRMLRVAVNGFFESMGVVLQVMEELDVDVIAERGFEGLEGVQGVEQGLTGTAGAVAV